MNEIKCPLRRYVDKRGNKMQEEHLDKLKTNISTDFLKKEYQRSLEGMETPDCSTGTCNACGLEKSQAACQKKMG